MGTKKIIVIDHSRKPSQDSTKQALDGCMEIAGGLFMGLQKTATAIVAKKKTARKTLVDQVASGDMAKNFFKKTKN